MSMILEILSVKILVLSIIASLLQNIFVDIFKCGENTHFQNIGFTVTNKKLLGRVLLIISSLIVFIVLYIVHIATLQEIILICLVYTVLAWIFYKAKIYTQIMDIVNKIKYGIINIIKKKLGA